MADAIRAQIKRATVEAHRAVVSLDARSLDELEALYKEAAAQIGAAIRARAGDADLVTLSQLQDLLGQVTGRLADLSRQRDALLNGALSAATNLGIDPFAMGMAPGVSGVARMQIHDEALRFVRTFVAEDGLQLSDRIWRLDRGARDGVVNAIEQAVIQGHGAGQAAREFLAQGKQVPVDLGRKADAARGTTIAKAVGEQLLTGAGNPLDNAMRLFRTEINRAHGEAYMMGGEQHPDFGGWRFLLSPAHPKPDICDLLSTQNVHGLGPGVYPSREKCPWPAHPNTLSFVEIVFKDEVTAADRAGRETPVEALGRLSPAARRGVLGVGKSAVFDAGQLTQGMIRAPWAAVKKRIGGAVALPPAPPPPKPVPKPRPPVTKPRIAKPAPVPKVAPPPKTLDEYLRAGRTKADELLARAVALGGNPEDHFRDLLLKDVASVRPLATQAKVMNNGQGADLVRAASRMFPDAWTKAADAFGPLYAKAFHGRGWQATLPQYWAGRPYKGGGFAFMAAGNDGMIVADNFATATHEYAHRLQHALTGLDDLFQELHGRRTAGEPLLRLHDLSPGAGYAIHEVTRKDRYISAYQGKEYGTTHYRGLHGALEVITMAFESALSGNTARLAALLRRDRDMLDLVIGTLYHYG